MAELSPIEKLKIIEDEFQKWFRKAYELKDYTDVDVDFLARELPGAKNSTTIQRYRYYDTQFKSTIKVPPQYQDTPNLFINALGKYFVDYGKFLYKDQIRYGYVGFQSSNPGDWCWIDVYKSCGDEVGSFCVKFQLEGNLVVAEVGYQIFGQVILLASPPEMLKVFNRSAFSVTGRGDLLNSVPQISDRLRYLLCGSLLLMPILAFVLSVVFALSNNEGLKAIGVLFSCCCVSLFLFVPFGVYILNGILVSLSQNRKNRLHRQECAIQQDLSPIHFPVKYFYTEDFNNAFSKSHDHQIFFKQLQEVVNRMSALGESSNS